MKKLTNDPQNVIRDSMTGLALAHPDILKVSFDPTYVIRADAPVAGKVAIVSGGGSGQEPMHVGFVGKDMLDAACPGQVFTSPTPDQIEAATRVKAGRCSGLTEQSLWNCTHVEALHASFEISPSQSRTESKTNSPFSMGLTVANRSDRIQP